MNNFKEEDIINLTNDEKILLYKNTYRKVYGIYPRITKKGAWIYINANSSAFRIKDLPKMADNLLDYDRIRTSDSKYPWEVFIKSDLIKNFLGKLYESCGHSLFDMEKALKDFAFSNKISFFNSNSNSNCNPTDCNRVHNLLNSIEKYKRQIDAMMKREEVIKRQNEIREEDIKSSHLKVKRKLTKENEGLRKEIEELRKEIEELRKNSVLFTMNDLSKQYGKSKRKTKKINIKGNIF